MSNGTIDYNLGHIESDMKNIKERLKRNDESHKMMRKDIRDLNVWRWKTAGVATTIGTILGFVLNKLF